MAKSISNAIMNADFANWPGGLTIPITNKLSETAADWLIDFRKGTVPRGIVSLAKPNDMSLLEGQFALRLSLFEECAGYLRLIVPLTILSSDSGKYDFSGAFRRPNDASDSNLKCSEIFLGRLESKKSLTKIKSIKKNIGPVSLTRLRNIPVVIDEEVIAGNGDGKELVLVYEFTGLGSLIIAQPELKKSEIVSSDGNNAVVAEFEDDVIKNQVSSLKLSPIWHALQIVPVVSDTRSDIASPIKLAKTSVISGTPFVQIVIPVFNAAIDVNELIASIIRNTDSPYEIILSDDCSDAFASKRIDTLALSDPRIKIIRHVQNIGYTRNINIALQSAVADYVVLLNSDTLVPPRWLERMTAVLLSHNEVGAVGPLSNAASWQSAPLTKSASGGWAVNMLPPNVDVDEMDSYVEEFSTLTYPDFPLLNGFCTLFRKSALDQVGYFDDENFPQGYGEENDLCLRLRKSGWKLKVADDTYVYHKKSKSFGSDRRAILSKKANVIIRSKHPEIKFTTLEDEMRTAPGLVELRRRLVEYLRIEMSDVIIR